MVKGKMVMTCLWILPILLPMIRQILNQLSKAEYYLEEIKHMLEIG
uniref:Uncharacterized protein n=1 Tax=Rhizophora mucronata TaxID=61149 RepID=A0A2P2KQI8_RHIMU